MPKLMRDKLARGVVMKIRRLLAEGLTTQATADRVKVPWYTVARIRQGIIYKAIR